jgi:hypothetical protein
MSAGAEFVKATYPSKIVGQPLLGDMLLSREELLEVLE